MGNWITSEGVPGSAPLHLSNGSTALLLDVLVLAGCDLATTPWEQALVYWLAQHDQARAGLGVVGFDVRDLGWTQDGFAEQKRFVVAVIESALRRSGWERLPFVPDEPRLFDALGQLLLLVRELPSTAVGALAESTWSPGDEPDGRRCEVHRVYLHETGCIICNDAPIDAAAELAPHRSPRAG